MLLCSVYMPCDSEYDQSNNSIYNGVLYEIIEHGNGENIDFVICHVMSLLKSLHTKSLQAFMDKDKFKLCDKYPHGKVVYAYESTYNGVRSILDHIMASENMFEFICLQLTRASNGVKQGRGIIIYYVHRCIIMQT